MDFSSSWKKCSWKTNASGKLRMRIDDCYPDWRILWTERGLAGRQGSASTAKSAFFRTTSFYFIHINMLNSIGLEDLVSKYARRLSRESIYRSNEEIPIVKVKKKERNWIGKRQRVPSDLIQLRSCLVSRRHQRRPTIIPRATRRKRPRTVKHYADVPVDSQCHHLTSILKPF